MNRRELLKLIATTPLVVLLRPSLSCQHPQWDHTLQYCPDCLVTKYSLMTPFPTWTVQLYNPGGSQLPWQVNYRMGRGD